MFALADDLTEVATSELQKLQTAIKYGDVDKAKLYASRLAEQKANIKIEPVISEEKNTNDFSVKVYIETKDYSGAFLDWKVTPRMTIFELSERLQTEQHFPIEVQTWIIGKRICRGTESLSLCGVASAGHSIYVYMVSASQKGLPVDPVERRNNRQTPNAREREEMDGLNERIGELRLDGYEEPVNRGHNVQAAALPEERLPSISMVGWECATCTVKNEPTRPGCYVCYADRPDGFLIPDFPYQMSEAERVRLDKEQQQERQLKEEDNVERERLNIEKSNNFIKHLQRAEQGLIQNTAEFTCTVCFLEIGPGEGIVLRECLHEFCNDCLQGLILANEEAEVKCPHQDEEYSCPAVLLDIEIKHIVSEENYFRYLDRRLNLAENASRDSFHCKTADCVGWCFYDDDVNFFTCPVCDKKNCLTCKAIHPDQNCKEFQDDLKLNAQNDHDARKTQEALQKMLTDGDAISCPQCNIVITKKLGCDWLRCSMCKTEICWITKGMRWGPKGQGDISGGCKCNVNGRKCHPQCGNCH